MTRRKVFAGAVADEPTMRKGLQIMYVPRIGIANVLAAGNPMRNTATGATVPRAKPKTSNEIAGRLPGGRTIPEDGRRYELMINGKNGIARYQIMIDPNGTENKKGHIKYTITNWDGSKTNKDKIFTPNYHNRWRASKNFGLYNKESNHYKPIDSEYFIENFSEEPDTDEDEKFFNNLYN